MNIENCPFCGANADKYIDSHCGLIFTPQIFAHHYEEKFHIECHNCGGKGPSSIVLGNAVDLWNARPLPSSRKELWHLANTVMQKAWEIENRK